MNAPNVVDVEASALLEELGLDDDVKVGGSCINTSLSYDDPFY